MNSILETVRSHWPLWLALSVVYLLVRITMAPRRFFSDRGIPYKKSVPFLGSMAALICRRETLYDMILNTYKEFKGNKVYGMFDTLFPVLAIRDPELIKQITIKDFEHFLDHRTFMGGLGPFFDKSLFMLTGQKWRDMRATLSPVFTGSKMRQMFQLVVECADQHSQIMLARAKESKRLEPTEMKDMFTRFSNDVIATAAFGLKVNSMENPTNDFYMMGKKSTDLTSVESTLKCSMVALMPRVAQWLNIRLFGPEHSAFYHDLVHDTIRHREKEGIVRPDMIHLLMQARKGALKRDTNPMGGGDGEGFATAVEVKSEDLRGLAKQVWTDEDVTAQCFLFILAGFETSSTLLCFVATELMENPDVQRRLIDEVDGYRAELDGKPLTYDVLQQMKYMDMVVSETLRKWPPVVSIDRICCKPYTFQNESGRKIEIKEGDGVLVPVLGLHRDPEHYPEPDRFDPERFSDARKGAIRSGTYLPFGSGPRNCIGSRFALMECKSVVYYLLSKFTIEPAPNSTIPLRLAKSGFTVRAENGYNVILKPRF